MNIGFLIIATNKYSIFVLPLVESAEKYFLPNQDVTYYIFTDNDKLLTIDSNNIKAVYKKHEPWPLPTLMRYKEFTIHKDILKNEDYLYYCDADMRFVGDVGDEILGDRMATIHPGFLGGRGTPETRPESTAYISSNENLIYYAGGFNGGSSKEFLHMSTKIAYNIEKDLRNDIVAIWHDESHLNRYFVDNAPTVVLTPSYCFPEGGNLPFEQKLLSLDKDNAEIRS